MITFYRVEQLNFCMFEFLAFLLPTNLRQPMHSPSALTEHVSLNLAGTFCSNLYLCTSGAVTQLVGFEDNEFGFDLTEAYSACAKELHKTWQLSDSTLPTFQGFLSCLDTFPRLSLFCSLSLSGFPKWRCSSSRGSGTKKSRSLGARPGLLVHHSRNTGPYPGFGVIFREVAKNRMLQIDRPRPPAAQSGAWLWRHAGRRGLGESPLVGRERE